MLQVLLSHRSKAFLAHHALLNTSAYRTHPLTALATHFEIHRPMRANGALRLVVGVCLYGCWFHDATSFSTNNCCFSANTVLVSSVLLVVAPLPVLLSLFPPQ